MLPSGITAPSERAWEAAKKEFPIGKTVKTPKGTAEVTGIHDVYGWIMIGTTLGNFHGHDLHDWSMGPTESVEQRATQVVQQLLEDHVAYHLVNGDKVTAYLATGQVEATVVETRPDQVALRLPDGEVLVLAVAPNNQFTDDTNAVVEVYPHCGECGGEGDERCLMGMKCGKCAAGRED